MVSPVSDDLLTRATSQEGGPLARPSELAIPKHVNSDRYLAGCIVAYLPPPLARRAAEAEHRIVLVESQSAVIAAAGLARTSMIIADPSSDNGTTTDLMIDLCERFRPITVAAYTRLTPEVVGKLLRLAAVQLSDVVLADHDDTPARLASLVEQASAAPLTRLVIERLDLQLTNTPAPLRSSIRLLFRNPLRYRTASDLAADAGMPRRTLYRHLRSAGINSPRLLVASGRVTRAVCMLANGGRTIRHVAEQLRFSRPELLSDLVEEVTGLPLRVLRSGFEPSALAASIVDRVCRIEDEQFN
jgi:AraC-like DNA-binding protein